MNHRTPYTYTLTGDLGKQRDTMLANELHLKSELGKARTRGHKWGSSLDLVESNDRLENNAAEALRGWPGLKGPLIVEEEKKRVRDFMGLNKGAIQSGLVTAPEHYDYRTTHDLWRIQDDSKRTGKSTNRIRRIPSSMTFGMRVRPSTPIFDLLEHKYQKDWIRERREKEVAERKEIIKKHQLHFSPTRTSQLRTFINPVDSGPLWQMPRFTRNARPHLQTFRSVTLNEDAMGNYKYDRISRKGTFGQGIYQPSAS